MKRLFINKKGIEITISFIVMLILAITVLAGSMVLITKFFGAAEEQKASIDSQTQSQIRSMLMGGAKVAIPINRIKAHRGDFVTFGVGILNVLRAGAGQDEFNIVAGSCKGATYEIEPLNIEQSAIVKKNDQKIFLVGYGIKRETPKETYICNIFVCRGAFNNNRCDDPYAESVYKAYIVVE